MEFKCNNCSKILTKGEILQWMATKSLKPLCDSCRNQEEKERFINAGGGNDPSTEKEES